MGDATAYLNDAKGYAEDLFNRYAALEIEHFVVASGQTYRADGPQLTTHSSPVTLSAPENRNSIRVPTSIALPDDQPSFNILSSFVFSAMLPQWRD